MSSRTRFAALLLPVLLAATTGVRPAAAQVVINEFSRDLVGNGFIELYNTRPDTTYDVTGWELVNDGGLVIPLVGLIPPNGYLTTPSNLVFEGGQIELYDLVANRLDAVAFGDQGGAPLPPPVGNFSCGRSPDGIDTDHDANDWNLDTSPTPSAPNDHASAELGLSDMRINEAGRAPGSLRNLGGCPAPPVIELHNVSAAPIDLGGWWLTDGRGVAFLDTIIAPAGFTLQTSFPEQFCFEASGVIYLFDPLGRRVDQVGVHPAVLPGSAVSYQKIPDGAPPFDGFDFPSSGGGDTWRIRPRTYGESNSPALPAPEVEIRSWGTTKAGYRRMEIR